MFWFSDLDKKKKQFFLFWRYQWYLLNFWKFDIALKDFFKLLIFFLFFALFRILVLEKMEQNLKNFYVLFKKFIERLVLVLNFLHLYVD